jgi:hypothetical protein
MYYVDTTAGSLKVYCDMNPSEPGWALISSYALKNIDVYNTVPLAVDLPRGADPNFDDYRLSKVKMNSLVTSAGDAKFRVTCNAGSRTNLYDKDIVQARMATPGFNIMTTT